MEFQWNCKWDSILSAISPSDPSISRIWQNSMACLWSNLHISWFFHLLNCARLLSFWCFLKAIWAFRILLLQPYGHCIYYSFILLLPIFYQINLIKLFLRSFEIFADISGPSQLGLLQSWLKVPPYQCMICCDLLEV